MSAKLVVEEGNQKGLSLSIEEGDSWIIGSDPTACQLVLGEAEVSDMHLHLERTPEGIVVENLASDQPLIINEEESVDSTYLLQNGDTIKVGNETLRFYEESSAQVHLPLEDETTKDDSLDEETKDEGDLDEEKKLENAEEENEILDEADQSESEQSEEELIQQHIKEEEEEIAEAAEQVNPQESDEITDPEEESVEEPEQTEAEEESEILDEGGQSENEQREDEHLQEQIGEEEIEIEKGEEARESSDLPEDDGMPLQEDPKQNEETPNEMEYHTEETDNLNQEIPANSDETPLSTPNDAPEPQDQHFEEEHPQDTIFSDDSDYSQILAEIDFGIVETGRWLLKVVGGPNSGAEFYMQAGNSYLVGTDPQTCDIIFHDTSVSRQHAKITVTPEDSLLIEDLNSRNGTLINGTLIQHSQDLTPSTIVTLGTTSFVVYDREGEMQTIISPLLPSIVKGLHTTPSEEENKTEPAETMDTHPAEGEPIEEREHPQPHDLSTPTPPPPRSLGSYVVISVIVALFAIAGIGTLTLFQDNPIKVQVQENGDELIQETLKPFPSIHWTFNKSNGSLLLLGHVLTTAEKNRVLYRLSDLKFIKNIDDSGIIIDEGVLSEVNSLLLNNPEWKGIRVFSPEAGQFILSGTLKNRRMADQLFNYISLNFPYLDGLKKQIIIEEDIVQQAQSWLTNANLTDITVEIKNGEVIVAGSYPSEKASVVANVIDKIEQIPGVRSVKNQTSAQTIETGIIDISDHYLVTGTSRVNSKYTVVINGRILSEGDELDGMTIDKISPNSVLLHRGNDRFRITY